MFAKKRSEIRRDSESEKEVENSSMTRRWSRNALDLPVVPKLEIPFSVQAVISRIEQAQLLRAREDVTMQLNDIMDNVHRIINRYSAIDLNSSFGRKSSNIESKLTQRNLFLEKMDAYANAADFREKTLTYILAWLEEWNAILSEITIIDVDEHHHWIAQMEMLPDTLKAINNNVKILCKLSRSFLEDKKQQKKKMLSRGTLWKSWKERATKRPATAHALRPDQMIVDQLATNTKVLEIQDMLQELIGTAMFNKMENNAIKYISSTIINFSKALNILNDELKINNFQNATIYVDEVKEEEKDLSLKIIQDLSEQNEMLTRKLRDAEEKCEQLIRSKVVSGRRAYTSLPTFSTFKVPPRLSPQSSMTTEDTMDSLLTKEFENIIDESQRRETKGTGIKWDSAFSYTAQVEMTPDLTEQQYILPEKKRKIPSQDIARDNTSRKKDDNDKKDGTDGYSSQKINLTKDPHPRETSKSNLSTGKDEQKPSEAKPSQYAELQALEKKKKRRKSSSSFKSKLSTESKSQHISSIETKSQDQKSGKHMWEQLSKFKPEYSLGKGPIPSETKVETSATSMDKDSKSELSVPTEPFSMIKANFTSEPQKVEMKGKKHQTFLGTTTSKEEKTEDKEMLVFTKQAQSQQIAKSQSEITKEILASPDGKSEQGNLELFQKAILAFLKEKIDNTGKLFDKKRMLKEEELLIKAEVEKLGVIKAKMEEYFQKVAETVTKILRKYKDTKMEGKVGEKPKKQKQGVSLMPGLHFQESSINAKSEISSFLSNESTDPVVNNLIQMILAEMESERDVPEVLITRKSHKEKGKQQQEEYLQQGHEQMSRVDLKHHQPEVRNLWMETYKMISENLKEKKALLQTKEGKQGQQEQKQGQEEEVWKEQQKQRFRKQTRQDEKQKQWESEREERQKTKQQQQLEAWKEKMREQGMPLEEENREKIQQVQKEMRHQDLKMSREKDDEKQKLSREIEDLRRQRENIAKYQMKKKPKELAEMISQSPVKLSLRETRTLKNKTQIYQEKKIQRDFKTLESLADGKHHIPVTPPTSIQSSSPTGTTLVSGQPLTKHITLSPEQALALGITPTPQEVQKMEFTTAPVIAQILTSQQAQAFRAPLTLGHISKMQIPYITEQAQELGTTRTQEQAQAARVPVTLEQAQTLKESLIREKTQTIQSPSTTKQSQISGVPIAQGKTEALRIIQTPQQAQDLGITLTPQQAQDLGITLTPQQAQGQRITLTAQQAKDLGITLTPQQAQDLGITLTPQQAQSQRITLTPQQVKDLGITLTPQQATDLELILTPQQATDLELILTPHEAQDLGITLTPHQAPALGNTFTPQQKQVQRIILTPQQVQAFGTPVTWQQLATLAPSTLRPPQELKASFSTRQSLTPRLSPRPRLPLTSSAPPAEKIAIPGLSFPLQKLRPPLSQAPFTPAKHLGMSILSVPGRLLGPQILPTSRQMLVLKGQAIPTETLAQEVSPAPGQHPISGTPPMTEQPHQPEALSSGHFILRGPLTPWPPLASQATLTLRPPLISGVSPKFGQSPRLWAPLSPVQHLVPGASSIGKEERLESEPLASSEWPQGFQSPATPEHSLQAPSTFRQHLAPWDFPEQVSPLWTPPSSWCPSTLWASPIPGKPQRVPSSSVTQKRLAIVSSLKCKSAVVQGRATDFKIAHPPFTAKKFQISEPSETKEETQILRDTCVTKPFETFQSSLTSYRTTISQTPYIDEVVRPTFMKPTTSLPSLITQIPKTPQFSPSEGDQKSRILSTEQPWILTSVSDIKKSKAMVPPSSPKEIVEKRYFVDVKAQRKNLILLNQATKTSGLPSQQHTTARNLIIEILHMDTVRLGYLLHKYTAYRLIQHARNNIIKQLKAIQNTGKGYKTQNLYIMLSRIDDYQRRVMRVWTEKQKSLEQKRNQCLKKMMHLFSQFQEMYKLNLSQPIPLIIEKKHIPASTKLVQQPFLGLLIDEDKKSDIFKKFRQKEALREAMWNAELSTSSYPITEKTSISSLWAQLGGYPDIPRLIQFDIQSTFRKCLASIQSQRKIESFSKDTKPVWHHSSQQHKKPENSKATSV